MGSQIAKLTTDVKDLLAHSTKLEADVAIVKNVNSKLVERVVVKKMLNTQEGTCWRLEYKNTIQYMQKVCNVFQEIGGDICDCDIQTVIVWRIKIKQLLNLPTEKIVFKYWE